MQHATMPKDIHYKSISLDIYFGDIIIMAYLSLWLTIYFVPPSFSRIWHYTSSICVYNVLCENS